MIFVETAGDEEGIHLYSQVFVGYVWFRSSMNNRTMVKEMFPIMPGPRKCAVLSAQYGALTLIKKIWSL